MLLFIKIWNIYISRLCNYVMIYYVLIPLLHTNKSFLVSKKLLLLIWNRPSETAKNVQAQPLRMDKRYVPIFLNQWIVNLLKLIKVVYYGNVIIAYNLDKGHAWDVVVLSTSSVLGVGSCKDLKLLYLSKYTCSFFLYFNLQNWIDGMNLQNLQGTVTLIYC